MYFLEGRIELFFLKIKYCIYYGSLVPIKNRRFIDQRPKIVDEKGRKGDWEIYHCWVVSIVERVSKKTVLKKVSRKSASLVENATIDGLNPYFDSVLSITADNGSEFAYHDKSLMI